MATAVQKRTQRRVKGKLSAGEGRRAVITVAGLTTIMLLTIFATTGSYLSPERSFERASISKITPLVSAGQGEAGAAQNRVASIVVETDKKGRCEERHFDNRTGKMVSSSYVDCEARLQRDTTPSDTINSERIRAILGAFKK